MCEPKALAITTIKDHIAVDFTVLVVLENLHNAHKME